MTLTQIPVGPARTDVAPPGPTSRPSSPPAEPLTLVDAKHGSGSGSAGRQRRRRLPRRVSRTLGPLTVVALWQVMCSAGLVSKRTLASPAEVVRAAQELWATGDLQQNLLISLQRAAIGLALGIAVGVTLAVIAGLFRIGEDLVDPTIQIIRSVPILGLIPLVIIWFGVGDPARLFLIALGTSFPIYLNTYAGIRNVDAGLVEVGNTFGLSRWGLIGRIVLPGALPGFLVGLRYALVGSWLILVVAEQINARSGLGYLVTYAATWYRTDIIVLALALYGILGLLADGIVRGLERTLLVWRRGFSGT
jgi:sulfonate transport system permease protein